MENETSNMVIFYYFFCFPKYISLGCGEEIFHEKHKRQRTSGQSSLFFQNFTKIYLFLQSFSEFCYRTRPSWPVCPSGMGASAISGKILRILGLHLITILKYSKHNWFVWEVGKRVEWCGEMFSCFFTSMTRLYELMH